MNWQIIIENLATGGFCPAFWATEYSSFGNRNQASKMLNTDLTNPSFMNPGLGLANLTNGTQAGAVTTLLRGILDYAQASDVTFGTGGNKLYKLSSTAVTNDANFPRTILKVKSTILKSPASNKTVDGQEAKPWDTPTKAYESDNVYATADLSSTQKFHCWFNFSLETLIPDGATIKGIEVKMEAKVNESVMEPYISFGLTKNKQDVAGNGVLIENLTTSDVIYTLGGASDLWGTTWAKSNFGTDFGISWVTGNTNTGRIVSIDHIQIKVYYTTTLGGGEFVDGEDVAYYQGKVYYSYNTDENGGIGRLTLPNTFLDNWGSSTPIGATALQKGVPHRIVTGGLYMFVANKNYVTAYFGYEDNDVFTEDALDLPSDYVIQDMVWAGIKLWITANKSDLAGSNKSSGSIFIWDTYSPTFEDEIVVNGKVGAIKVKNGIVYVFYQDISDTGGYKLGYISGSSIVDVANFTGSLPAYYQVTEYKNFLIWVSGGSIWAFGAIDKNLPSILFQLADGGYSTVGGLAAPFGTPMVASTESTLFKLAKFSGYDTNSTWYSLLFDVTGTDRYSMIDRIKFNFEKLATGAKIDWTLKDNKGTSLRTGAISFATDGAVTTKTILPKNNCENFRLELSHSFTTNPVSIKNVKIEGHTIS